MTGVTSTVQFSITTAFGKAEDTRLVCMQHKAAYCLVCFGNVKVTTNKTKQYNSLLHEHCYRRLPTDAAACTGVRWPLTRCIRKLSRNSSRRNAGGGARLLSATLRGVVGVLLLDWIGPSRGVDPPLRSVSPVPPIERCNRPISSNSRCREAPLSLVAATDSRSRSCRRSASTCAILASRARKRSDLGRFTVDSPSFRDRSATTLRDGCTTVTVVVDDLDGARNSSPRGCVALA